jgi:hypothetical protein
MSARKLSYGTNAAIVSSGSPFSDDAKRPPNRVKKSQLSHRLAPQNHVLPDEFRTAPHSSQLFEAPFSAKSGARRSR